MAIFNSYVKLPEGKHHKHPPFSCANDLDPVRTTQKPFRKNPRLHHGHRAAVAPWLPKGGEKETFHRQRQGFNIPSGYLT